MKKTAKELIKDIMVKVVRDDPVLQRIDEKDIVVLPTLKEEFGEFYTNVAFRMKGGAFRTPKDAAEYIKEKILSLKPDFVERIDVKNGFLNFFLNRDFYLNLISEISAGDTSSLKPSPVKRKVLIEFVSANPTGPLTIAHGRQAAFGEALARILKYAGLDVTKEYYINDAGRQIKLLGESLKARYLQLKGIDCPIPEGGYEGEYLIDIAKHIKDESIDFYRFAADYILEDIKNDLQKFGVSFDNWVSESGFFKTGKVDELLRQLEEKGFIYSAEGSKWFKSSAFGDEKDRVVVKRDGSYTYLASDIAYHKDKIDRGYDTLINIVGPDHHGYIPRVKAVVETLGFNPENLNFIIVQLTTLYRGKEKLSMSTRKGQFISLKQLMDEVGPDASKFFFIFRKADSHLDFDLELAKKQSVENPIYYLQYAYVRMKHIIEFAKEKGMDISGSSADLSLLSESEEVSLAKYIARFPDTVEAVVNSYGVHLLAEYLLDIAKLFHSYYHKHRVVGDDPELTSARLVLTKALLTVFSLSLNLLNISLPEKM
ncbi:MAG TPA: arginine--tRNA ligase [bacterium]|nr:arginine--tRNA ligase [bacterium]HPP29338.1 arginine--tRNA ligase [bacterium]